MPNDNSMVCGNHFRTEDYERVFPRRVLKPNAVPTIFGAFPNKKNRAPKAPLKSNKEDTERLILWSIVAKYNNFDNNFSNERYDKVLPETPKDILKPNVISTLFGDNLLKQSKEPPEEPYVPKSVEQNVESLILGTVLDPVWVLLNS